MLDDPPAAELLGIAASTLPLMERARGLLESLDRWLPVQATWLALSDPQSNVYTTVGSTGLEPSTLDYLDSPSVSREIQSAGLNQNQPPVSLAELPVAVEELSTWAECLLPAGFREGLGVPLFEPGGPYLGMLTLLFSSGEPPTAALRDRLGRLAPLIARAVSPMRSLLATARLVQGATAGAVLFGDGTTYRLPGLGDHALLVADSRVVALARETLLAGQVCRSFMWPTQDSRLSTGHAHMTVLAATDVPAFVLGTILVTPDVECRSLTPRELEVLGLLVDGRSNQQIASASPSPLAPWPRTWNTSCTSWKCPRGLRPPYGPSARVATYPHHPRFSRFGRSKSAPRGPCRRGGSPQAAARSRRLS